VLAHDPEEVACMSAMSNAPEIPHGYCQCGCGQRTALATMTNSERNVVKGQPQRFMHGHRTKPPLSERFWSYVDKSGGPDACWPWTGARLARGYGVFGMAAHSRLCHRIAWELANDAPVPDGMDVLHSCDNPPCCNPAHLTPGTHRANQQDAAAKGRMAWGTRRPEAKLTETDIPEIRRLCAEGMRLQVVADRFGVGSEAITKIVQRQRWAHVP
jgi:hypothetical protein